MTDLVGERLDIDNRPAFYKLVFIVAPGGGWGAAYTRMVETTSELELLRRYRDELLSRDEKGMRYQEALYQRSEQALDVLQNHPELIREARQLIRENQAAVAEVLNGRPGIIDNTDDVAAFLAAYAKQSPPGLRLLVHLIRLDMLAQRKQGNLFFGFKLE